MQTSPSETKASGKSLVILLIVLLTVLCVLFRSSFDPSQVLLPSTLWGYSAPDFAKLGTAYGIASRTISAESEIAEGLKWMWEDPNSPALLNVMIDTYANAYPKIAFGFPITEMEPLVKPIEIEAT